MNIIEKRAISDTVELEEWYTETCKKLPPNPNITVQKDVPYMDDGNMRHTFDIYFGEHTGKMPVIFDFHGGGFISGDKKYNTWFSERMAEHGFLVFTFAYPLVFEKNLYGILADCYEGMKRAYAMLEELDGNPNAVFLCGDSAGGFLATYLAALNKDPDMAASIGVQSADIPIKALGTVSALFYCSRVDKNGIFIMRSTMLGKHSKKHPFWKYVNPEREVYQALPPVMGITSDGDFLQNYTLEFMAYMKQKGKAAQVYSYADKTLSHDFVIMRPDAKESRESIEKIAAFFKENMN